MANVISVVRTCIAIVIISLLSITEPIVYWLCVVLTILVIILDGLDGYIARKRGEATKIGAVLDILGDRIVENIFWIAFAVLGWLPMWVPVVVVIRGIVTDGLRSVALEQGYTAFGEHGMMRSRIGKYLVASRSSRLFYAAAKAAAFSLLIAAHVPGKPFFLKDAVGIVGYIAAYTAVGLCVVRGLPVMFESRRFFSGLK